jgi:hypothetical protein
VTDAGKAAVGGGSRGWDPKDSYGADAHAHAHALALALANLTFARR